MSAVVDEPNTKIAARWWVLAGILIALVAGSQCLGNDEPLAGPGEPSTRITSTNALSHSPGFGLEEAQQFHDFSIYWLGESFQGLPLTTLIKVHNPGFPGLESETENHVVSLGYGSCMVPPGAEACPIPLNINIQPYCESPPSDLAPAFTMGPPSEIRGAEVRWTGGSLAMWTNDIAISISGRDVGLVRNAANGLVALTREGAKSPGEPLGPPQLFDCPPHPHFNQTTNDDR